MKIDFNENTNENILSEEVIKLKEIITKLESSLNENLSIYFQFLSEQAKKENYLEIHWPFFDFGITLMLSIIKEKFLISVLNHNDSIVYGNLLIEGYPCISIDELDKLGRWNNYSENKLSILKPF